MKTTITTAMSVCFIFGAGTVLAADAKKLTMEQCKQHMTMTKAAGAKKDAATMKTTQICTEILTEKKK